jgi:plasmid stabilization system protein ParE
MFTVRWKRSAQNELTSLWVEADSEQRRAITRAAQAIDHQLQTDPSNQGESRPNGRRILFTPPLGILFRVDSQRSVVRVLQVWRF